MAEIRIDHLTVRFTNKKTKASVLALNDFSYVFASGSFTGIMGPSGAGKSTLLKTLINHVDYDEGDIYLDGKDIDDIPLRDRHFAYVSQDIVLYKKKIVFDNIAFPLLNKKMKTDAIREEVYSLANRLGIAHLLGRKVNQLSVGEMQIVNFAKAIIQKPSLVVFDEPFSNVDTKQKQMLKTILLQEIKQKGITCIFATNDEEDIASLADKVVIIERGEKIKDGDASRLLAPSLMTNKQEESPKEQRGGKYVLPESRKSQLGDIYRTRLSTLALCGAFIALFALPLIFFAIAKSRILDPELYAKNMKGLGYPEEAIPFQYVLSTLLYDGILALCYAVASLGLAGLFRVIRRIVWDEGVLFFKDFFGGIAIGWKRFCLCGICMGLILLVINFVSGMISISANANLGMAIELGLKAVCVVFLYPLAMLMLTVDSYFEQRIRDTFRVGSTLYVGGIWAFLLLSLAVIPVLFVMYIPNFYLLIAVITFLCVVLLPAYMVLFHVYANHLFDRYIEFPDKNYIRKGLFEAKTIAEGGTSL